MESMGKGEGRQPSKPGTASAIREATGRTDNDRPDKPSKRVYPPEFKARILRELAVAAASGDPGAQGALLRREGLYWAAIYRWRAEAKKAELEALAPRTPGRKVTRDPVAEEIVILRKQLERVQAELRRAEIIIDVQKKLSALLGVEMPATDQDEKL
jgi:transposase